MKNIIYLLVLLCIISCDNTSNSKISKEISKTCIFDTCEVDMSKIVSEDWDDLYIFDTNVSLEEIDSILGFNYPYFEDIATRIIFVKNRNIVYHEEEFPNPEKVKTGELLFDIEEGKHFIKVDKEHAIFFIKKERDYFIARLKS